MIVQSSIALLTCSKLRQSGSKVCTTLESLFFIFYISSTLFLMFTILLLSQMGGILEHFGIPGALLWFITLFLVQLTLVIRLYISFDGSSLAMTKNTVIIFALIFVFELVIMLTASVLLYSRYTNIAMPLTFLFVFLYFVGSALAVRLFVVNLSKVAQMQKSSQRQVTPTAVDISLNSKQKIVLHLAAKYILLFFVAISSTILSISLFAIWSNSVLIVFGPFLLSVDLSVNLWCLYLQFAFAKKHYQKCCGCLDSRCRNIVENRVKRKQHKDSLHKHAELAGTSRMSTSGKGTAGKSDIDSQDN